MDVENVQNYKRVMLEIEVLPVIDSLCCITITGYAFLWHQVRCMVAVLFLVGQHLESPSVVRDMLDIGRIDRKPMYDMASEIPLVLYDCGFEGVNWQYEADVQNKLVTHYSNIVHDFTIKSAVSKLTLEGVKRNCLYLSPQTTHVSLLTRAREDSLEERLARQESKKCKRGDSVPNQED